MSEALVCRIQTQELPDPKYTRVQLGVVAGGYRVVVGRSVRAGDMGLFFPADTQLDEAFCLKNSLLRKHPVTGEKLGGYLDENRRVRAISLCGVRSEGVWLPLSCLIYLGVVGPLNEGQAFATLALRKGVWLPGETVGEQMVVLAQRYYTPATQAARVARHSRGGRRETSQFPMHYETPQWKRAGDEALPEGAYVVVTEKLHGTSARVGLVLHDVPANEGLLARLWRRIRRRPAPVQRAWRYLCGTRRVISGIEAMPGKFSTDQPWRDRWANHISQHLRKGETAYYEIVGYQHCWGVESEFRPEFELGPHTPRPRAAVKGRVISAPPPIMPRQSAARLPEVVDRYGPCVTYSYGCEPGESAAYLYRLTMVSEDGHITELPWFQVEKRAQEMGIGVPPVLRRWAVKRWAQLFRDWLSMNEEGPTLLGNAHPREGICVRVESAARGVEVFKAKSWTFGVLEGYCKDRPDYVDTEEAA